LEFEFEYPNLDFTESLIKFNKGEDIKEEMIIEIVVRNKEYIKYNLIQDLNESFGNVIIDPKSNLIIKVPKEYNDNYNNFSIIQNFIDYNCYIDIFYDKNELMPLNLRYNSEHDYDFSQVFPLLM